MWGSSMFEENYYSTAHNNCESAGILLKSFQKWKSLLICRNFQLFHPEIKKRPKKPARLQEFTNSSYSKKKSMYNCRFTKTKVTPSR